MHANKKLRIDSEQKPSVRFQARRFHCQNHMLEHILMNEQRHNFCLTIKIKPLSHFGAVQTRLAVSFVQCKSRSTVLTDRITATAAGTDVISDKPKYQTLASDPEPLWRRRKVRWRQIV
jgi:hypothetical protein